MIKLTFNNWELCAYRAEPPAYQFDDGTVAVVVDGDIPSGWTWELIIAYGDNLDIAALVSSDDGLIVDLSAQQLAFSGYYTMQLRAMQGALVKHSAPVMVYIGESLSGDAHWPEIPTAFSQAIANAEAAIADAQEVQTAVAASETAAAQSAGDAAGSATAAAQSATTAAQSATDAGAYATSAAGSAESAVQSATEVAGSATDAAESATSAAASATAAAASATAAAESATDAAISATAAETARTAAENAQDAAEDAQSAAEAATTLKADKVVGAVAGNLAALDESGNIVDSGVDPIAIARRTLDTWAEIQEVVRLGKIGLFLDAESSQLIVPISTGGGAAVNHDFDVLGIDEDEPVNPALRHVLTIQAHDILDYGIIPFDPPQYLFAVTAEACAEYGWPATGMPAGTYNITLDHGSYSNGTTQDGTYEFTTTQVVPVGGGVRHTQIGIYRSDGAYTKENLLTGTFTTYAADRTTTLESWLATTEGSDGTNLGTTTASNPAYKVGNYINFSQLQAHGAGRWSTSFLRQYLNSDESTMTFAPATIWSRPLSTLPEGFLHKLPAELKAVLGKVRKRYALSIADGYGYEDVEDTVNLATMLDMNFGKNNNISEGPVNANGTVTRETPYTHWVGATNADRIKYQGTTARYWWLGSAYPSNAYIERYVYTSGSLNLDYAYYTIGVAPSLYII